MMIIARILFLILISLNSTHALVPLTKDGQIKTYIDNPPHGLDLPLTKDSRIKTYIYNPDEVYLLTLHYGFLSNIQFAKGETITEINLGNSFAWKITPINNRLLIKPLEENLMTNMMVVTNKRVYHFDVIAKNIDDDDLDFDLVYAIKFYYPKKN